jgi:hypothetical protein
MRGRAVATTADEFGDFYDARLAASDLKRYREKGPRPWTRTLIESLKADGVEGATLLDIGGGVGVIHHELLAAGVASAMCVMRKVEGSNPFSCFRWTLPGPRSPVRHRLPT